MSVFLSVDPLAEDFPGWNPYHYVHNNPINLIDPTGMAAETDYTLNKRTGDVKQVGETNDKPDRILQTNSRGEVKTNRDGSPKVAIDNIDKGILSDGMNFRTEGNVVKVGGKTEATKEGVERFAWQLSDYVRKEIKGAYFSNDGTENITHMTLGKYEGNTYTKSISSGAETIRGLVSDMKEFNSYKVKGFFHTHPNESTRFEPSKADINSRDNGLRQNRNLKYYILTHPNGYGSSSPHIIDYTNSNY